MRRSPPPLFYMDAKIDCVLLTLPICKNGLPVDYLPAGLCFAYALICARRLCVYFSQNFPYRSRTIMVLQYLGNTYDI